MREKSYNIVNLGAFGYAVRPFADESGYVTIYENLCLKDLSDEALDDLLEYERDNDRVLAAGAATEMAERALARWQQK